MEKESQNELIALYRALPAIEQGLVRLASVIYTGAEENMIRGCMEDLGPAFFGWEPISSLGLGKCLSDLQQSGLLDKHNRCHPDIAETASRHATTLKLSLPEGITPASIADPDAWSEKSGRCILCSGDSRQGSRTRYGLVCNDCSARIFRDAVRSEEISAWPRERLLRALGPEGTYTERITVLVHARHLLSDNNPGMDELFGLLADNLGHVTTTPISRFVRRLALDACVSIGKPVLPFILERCRPEPWQLNANCLLAAALIDPSGKAFQSLLIKTLQHPKPEVRRYVAVSLEGKSSQRWAKDILSTLARDPDPSVREAAQKARYGPYGANPAAHGSARQIYGYFSTLVNTVRRHASGQSYKADHRMRDLRMAFYEGNEESFRRTASWPGSGDISLEDALVRICNNPFDQEWFGTLSLKCRVEALYAILDHALFKLSGDREALAYAMEPGFLKSLNKDDMMEVSYTVISRLLMSGRIQDVERIVRDTSGFRFFGIAGWIAFLRGNNDKTIDLFEADIEALRRYTGDKKMYFAAYEGLFYILALIKKHHESEDARLLRKALSSIETFFQVHRGKTVLHGMYELLKHLIREMLGVEIREPDAAMAQQEPEDALSRYFFALSSLVISGNLDKKTADELKKGLARADAAGIYWISMEYSALLERAGIDRKANVSYLARIREQCGLQAVTPYIRADELWKRSLKALIEIAPSHEEEAGEKRLAWFLDFHSDRLTIEPKEQKRGKKTGEWTAGRAVHVRDLAGKYGHEYLDERDRRICRAIISEEQYRHYGSSSSNFPVVVMVRFIGHPRVFLAESPKTRVEIVKGEPEIFVHREGRGITLRPSVPPTGEEVVILRESPVRFKVIELSDAHRRVFRILGKNGLTVPEEAHEDALSAIRNISSMLTVQSSVECATGDIEQIDADPTPCMHILPSGKGFRLELFVRPFTGTGPYLKPGQGGKVVITDLDGRKHQAVRDLGKEKDLALEIAGLCSPFSSNEIGDMRWHLEDPEECLTVLADLYPLNSTGRVRVEWPEGEKLKLRKVASFEDLEFRVKGRHDWFEIEGELRVGDDVLDMKTLIDALDHSPARFIHLSDGGFLALTDEFRRKIGDLSTYASRKGDSLILHPLTLFTLDSLSREFPNFGLDDAARERIERFRTAQSLTPEAPSTFQAELRDYQQKGFEWLVRLADMGMGACLADDMGLGKTIQALALLLHRASSGPSLVVAPTSVCMNWVGEAKRFAPTLNVMLLNQDRDIRPEDLKAFDVLILSYGLLIQESDNLSPVSWNVIVLDEAQAIKNMAAKRTQAALSLKGDFRLITTGTPIENHLGEFFSLFHFLNPGLLGSRRSFTKRYAEPIEKNKDADARRRLKKLIQPFILRRLKSAVLDELPPMTEIRLEVDMGKEEIAFYEALRQRAIERLSNLDVPPARQRVHILSEITRLRQACCTPKLIMPDTDIPSAKTELFGEIIDGLRENRHKALVFSQFVGHLAVIRKYLDERSISYCYLDGSTPAPKRAEQVEAFQAGKADLFLISLKAGGMGLNLTAADYVIHMDPWWNPAVEDQASGRAHRIGQERPVTVYRMITRHTIEEKIVALHREKRDLADSLLEGSDIGDRISPEELIALIREH